MTSDIRVDGLLYRVPDSQPGPLPPPRNFEECYYLECPECALEMWLPASAPQAVVDRVVVSQEIDHLDIYLRNFMGGR